jgi:hypothetical protein
MTFRFIDGAASKDEGFEGLGLAAGFFKTSVLCEKDRTRKGCSGFCRRARRQAA